MIKEFGTIVLPIGVTSLSITLVSVWELVLVNVTVYVIVSPEEAIVALTCFSILVTGLPSS